MSRYRLLTGSLCLLAAVAVRGDVVLTPDAPPESDPVAYPVATNALALAKGALTTEADTLATVTARGATTASAVTIGARRAGAVGVSSFANGQNVVASGSYSHADGLYATASGSYSHAEGRDTAASGDYSHAEGEGTKASGHYSHAEGRTTTASGSHSHASGFKTVASHATSFAWQGTGGGYNESPYGSHGHGTFNINPVGGLAGLWIGETNMATAVRAEVEATSPKLTMVPIGTTVISTDTTVQVVPTCSIYKLSVTGDADISFDLSSIDITNNVARWETWIKVADPSMTVGLPSTNAVQYLETPDLTTTTANELMQISWQAWKDGASTLMQASMYGRVLGGPVLTPEELRLYHYGSTNIIESPDEWFDFDPGTGTITSFNYEGDREDVVIPWEIGGVAVEAIGEWAFSIPYYDGFPIETLIGPKTLLSIGNDAFRNCKSLTSIILPAATSIEYGAFSDCTSLTSMSLPVATALGDYAFSYCTSLTSVSLPAATAIGSSAFHDCTSLTSISLPAATSIGGYETFFNCYSLTSVYFGTTKPPEEYMFYLGGDPINVTIYYPTGAAEWSDVTTWSGQPTAPYTPPAP